MSFDQKRLHDDDGSIEVDDTLRQLELQRSRTGYVIWAVVALVAIGLLYNFFKAPYLDDTDALMIKRARTIESAVSSYFAPTIGFPDSLCEHQRQDRHASTAPGMLTNGARCDTGELSTPVFNWPPALYR